jgi:hypothetical protein
MKKIVLISSYCDTQEKINILSENIKVLKSLGLDTLVISPITLPKEIIELSDFVFFTKENPLLNWPLRGFTFWKTHYSIDGWVTMHRNVADYGWAGLYQIKKMSQIALSYDYDLFYHIIYDLKIDQYVIDTIKSDKPNLIHPRINPNKNNEWWDVTLHFMVFDREIMSKIVDVIVLEDYLKWDGVAEGQALMWTQLFDIEISKTPVEDKIYYWGDREFFNYSFNSKYKMFISKIPNTNIWVEENGVQVEKDLSSNLTFYFYDFLGPQTIKINVDGITKEYELNQNKIINFDVDSTSVKSISLTDNDDEYDYTTVYKEISRNLIYLGG